MVKASGLVSVLAALSASCGSRPEPADQGPAGAIGRTEQAELAAETIYIVRGGGPYGERPKLTYELLPGTTVTLTLEAGQEHRKRATKTEVSQLPTSTALYVRRLLLRVRPEHYKGVEQEKRPRGCKRSGPHDFADVDVTYVAADVETTTFTAKDRRIGRFALPSSTSCGSVAAREAREVMRKVFALMPRTKLIAEFEGSQ